MREANVRLLVDQYNTHCEQVSHSQIFVYVLFMFVGLGGLCASAMLRYKRMIYMALPAPDHIDSYAK